MKNRGYIRGFATSSFIEGNKADAETIFILIRFQRQPYFSQPLSIITRSPVMRLIPRDDKVFKGHHVIFHPFVRPLAALTFIFAFLEQWRELPDRILPVNSQDIQPLVVPLGAIPIKI